MKRYPFDDETAWGLIREDGRLAFFLSCALIFETKRDAEAYADAHTRDGGSKFYAKQLTITARKPEPPKGAV